MKVFAKREVEIEVDRLCDVCGESVLIHINGQKYPEYGELKASFGYGSNNEDGNTYHLDLCQCCFKEAIMAMKDKYKSHIMFDNDKELPDASFGLVSTEDDGLRDVVKTRLHQKEIEIKLEDL